MFIGKEIVTDILLTEGLILQLVESNELLRNKKELFAAAVHLYVW